MRSPGATFNLRGALSEEVNAALGELNITPLREKGLHRCRVHLKRARALARIGRACAPGLSAVFNDTARGVMRSLAQARDLAALAESARELAKKSKKKSAAALNNVADGFDHERREMAPLNLEVARAGLRDLLALAQVWPEASPRQIERGAERIALRARKACGRGRNASAPPRRHEWRKREKDRLYASTLLDRSWPDDFKRRRKRGERLSDVLGRERDLLLLIQRVEADPNIAGSLKHAEAALKTLRQRRDRLGRRADLLGAMLHKGGA
ncbi:MAG: CHAD domain-containing protein [Pseudomonadota bacterium]